jgi:carboxymethylenebutenolidase
MMTRHDEGLTRKREEHPMKRTDVNVTTPDGVCPSIVIAPDGAGSWPAVILFMDAGGVRPAMIEMAEQLAGMGYVAFLPEMYYRYGAYEPFNFETVFTDTDERNRLFAMIGGVTKAMAASDAGAFLEFLSGLPQVAGTKVGTTGYCMGGGLSLTAAAHHPDRIVAAASFHGGFLASDAPDSPHLVVGQITGRVYVAGAEDDGSYPPEQAALLEDALTKAGVDHTLETYPALHGFAVPDNPTYDAGAAARHWRALEDLYGSMLSS